MRTLALVAVVGMAVAVLGVTADQAQADHHRGFVYWGGGPAYYAPAPVYYAPAPVYYAPAPVYYAPAPAYYPPPVYYAAPPVYYAPPPVYYTPAYVVTPRVRVISTPGYYCQPYPSFGVGFGFRW